jgi:dienelactone hydrolase
MGEQLAYGILPPLEYNPQAAKLAWKRTLEFFDQRLRK